MSEKVEPPPASSAVASDPIEQAGQVLKVANDEKSPVAESTEHDEIKDDTASPAKEAQPSLANYFVSNQVLYKDVPKLKP